MATATRSILAARYQLAAPLGQGGMGQVWAATHLLTGRAVALKQLLAAPAGKSSQDARARFLLEAQSACAVEHPHVVQVLDFVDDGDQPPFLVMELLQGETLASKLARESVLSLEETLRLALPIVSAAGAAHARGIIHRDLKPSNIFLHAGQHGLSEERRPLVKVLDFGIAKWLEGDRLESGSRTQTGSTLGTPRYMSPEQATAERSLDHRTDIWSIGVMLYECLSGALPVDGENAAQMVMRLLSSGIIPIEHLVPSLPPELSRLIGRMLARDPDDRPQDLQEPFTLLARLSGEQAPSFGKPRQPASLRPPDDAEPAPPLAPLALSVPPEATWPPVTRPPEPGSKKGGQPPARLRRGRWLSLGLLLGGVALGVGLLLLVRSAPAPAVGRPALPATAAALAVLVEEPVPPLALPLPAPSPEPSAPSAAAVSVAVSPPAPKLRARPAAPEAPRKAPARGRPPGAECDRSGDCASRACVAFACQ